MKKISFKFIMAPLFFAIFIMGFLTNYVSASSYDAIAPIIPSSDYTTDIGSFIKSIYNFGISIVGILALLQLTRGGIMYMVAGAVNTKEAAKRIMTDAFIGLGLALASFLILNVINPKMTTLGIDLQLEPAGEATKCMTGDERQNYINYGYTCTTTAGGSCSLGQTYIACSR